MQKRIWELTQETISRKNYIDIHSDLDIQILTKETISRKNYINVSIYQEQYIDLDIDT